MPPYRIGLLGASRIAPKAIVQPSDRREDTVISVVGARDGERARAYAGEHGIGAAVEGYDALVNHPQVDVVYNALPPSEHVTWNIKAMEAGKHVLCEKPFAMNAAEARTMVEAAQANGRHLIEAFHCRYHPLFDRILDLVRSRTVGTLTHTIGVFTAAIPPNPGELRHIARLGGGALMDLGCYAVHWQRTVAGEEPQVVGAAAVPADDPGVDLSVEADLEFPSGIKGRVVTSMAMDIGFEASLRIIGDAGEIVVVNPLAPHRGHSLTVTTATDTWNETVDGQATYDHQLEAVVRIIEGDMMPLTGGADAIGNMQVIDDIYSLSGLR